MCGSWNQSSCQNDERISMKLRNHVPALSVGILAGGNSTRMGQNKALMEWNQERMIDRLADRMGAFSEVIISAADRGVYENMGLPIVYDVHRNIGPMEGIYQVLSKAKNEYVFICAVDMPNVSAQLVSYLADFICSDYDCYVIADEDHIQPLCAIYSKKILPVIEELISKGEYRLRNILSRVRTKYVSLEYSRFDKSVVKNINTYADYVELAKPFVFCVSGLHDSGKTGLIVKLINEFIGDGYSVGVLKHDGHDCYTDVRGSDTARFTEAGAVCTSIMTKSRYSIHVKESMDVAMLIEQMCRMESVPDIIIIEGMKHSGYPKIEVIRQEICGKSVCDPRSLICIAADEMSFEQMDCPVYGLSDIQGIFLCLKKYFGLERLLR